MSMTEIRWKQRFNNYRSALAVLAEDARYCKENATDERAQRAMIKSFEFVYDLAGKVLNDYLKEQGEKYDKTYKGVVRAAFSVELITDADIWMEMIDKRNKTAHTYDKKIAIEVVQNILTKYLPAFEKLQNDFQALYDNGEG